MNKILEKIYSNPIRVFVYFLLKIFPNKIFHRKFYYHDKLHQKYFLLSFDCDVQEDLDCLDSILKRLKKIGIRSSVAIPGELIEQNIDLIRSLLKKYEFEVINHGYFIHTEIYDDIYVSSRSYNDKLVKDILEDIKKGHEVIKNLLNHEVKGFRTPHFGEINFDIRKKINNFLLGYGYEYSSSTIYDHIFLNGPISNYKGIVELSVSGCANNLYQILDSWTYLKSGSKIKNTFRNELQNIQKLFIESDKVNYLNIYVDPSHVNDQEYFFDFLKELSNYSKYNLIEFAKKYKG